MWIDRYRYIYTYIYIYRIYLYIYVEKNYFQGQDYRFSAEKDLTGCRIPSPCFTDKESEAQASTVNV